MKPAVVIKYDNGRVRDADRYGRRDRENAESSSPTELTLSWTAIQDLLTHQRELEAKLIETKELLKSGDHDAASAALEGTSDHTLPVRTFLEAVEDTIPAFKRPSTTASTIKASEVFSTPELLEMILLHLTTPQKLGAMQVCRTWRDTLNCSIELLRSLGLATGADETYYSPFALTSVGYPLTQWVPGVKFYELDPDEYGPESSSNTPTNSVRLILYLADSFIVDGTRLRSMLICSPPLTTISAVVHCQGCRIMAEDDFLEQVQVVSRSPNGYTLGELVEVTARLCKDHAQCGSSTVEFSAEVELHPEHPLIIERREKQEEAIRRDKEDDELMRSMTSQNGDGDDEDQEERASEVDDESRDEVGDETGSDEIGNSDEDGP